MWFGFDRLLGGSGGGQHVDDLQQAPSVDAPWMLEVPAGAKSERGLTMKGVVGKACFAIALSQEAVITPSEQQGLFDLHTSAKGAFDTRGFGKTLRLDSDYWPGTVTNALREGKIVWTTDVNYNDYDIKTRAA